MSELEVLDRAADRNGSISSEEERTFLSLAADSRLDALHDFSSRTVQEFANDAEAESRQLLNAIHVARISLVPSADVRSQYAGNSDINSTRQHANTQPLDVAGASVPHYPEEVVAPDELSGHPSYFANEALADPGAMGTTLPVAKSSIETNIGPPEGEVKSPTRLESLSPKIGSVALLGQVRLASEVAPRAFAKAGEHNTAVHNEAARTLIAKTESDNSAFEADLAEDFRLMAQGDEVARKRTEANSISEVIEMACKSGSEMIAHAEVVGGTLNQFGKTTRERQYNTLTTFSFKFNGLQEMVSMDGRNAFFIDELLKQGVLQRGNKVVEISLVPDKPHHLLKGAGLFLREVVAIIRITEADADNNVTIKSYLVGGTDQTDLPSIADVTTEREEESMEKKALHNRFDIAAARQLLSRFGVQGAETMSPEEILGTPLIMSGESDGIDIVMAYDEIVSSLTGQRSMLGSASLYQKNAAGRLPSRSDYQRHFAKVHGLQKNLQAVGRTVAQKCAKRWYEVAGDKFAAGRLMHEIAEKEVANYLADCVRESVLSPQKKAPLPDLTVLGVRSYRDFMAYQQRLTTGDLEGAKQARADAVDNAKGTGCPTGADKSVGVGGDGTAGGTGADANSEKPEKKKFSTKEKMTCPFCKAKVYDDPCARVLKCWDCKAKVVDGKVVYKGDGGSRARAAKKMGINGIGFWITEGGQSRKKPSKKKTEKQTRNSYALAA